MLTARAQREARRSPRRKRTVSRTFQDAKRHEHPFVSWIFRIGITIVLLSVLWTAAMVLLEALEQWRR